MHQPRRVTTRLMHGTNPLYLRQKRSWPISLKIYQHPPTLNTKIPGNFRPTTDCFSTTKIILQKTEEIWQNFG